jgi:hypothetical protein
LRKYGKLRTAFVIPALSVELLVSRDNIMEGVRMDHVTRAKLRREIEQAINRACAENDSNTPDFILADYLMLCLDAFTTTSLAREHWFGYGLEIGGPVKKEDTNA